MSFDADFCAKVKPQDLEVLGWDFTTGYEQDDQLVAPGRLKWGKDDYIKLWISDAGKWLKMYYAVVLDGLEGDTKECDASSAKIDLEILHERGRLWLQ